MSDETAKFGAMVRQLRESRRIGLRKFAQQVGMSPTYLSKIERGELKPPAEEKVRAIANALERDPDELLALAGRLSSELQDIIQRYPREMASFLRAAAALLELEAERNKLQAYIDSAPKSIIWSNDMKFYAEYARLCSLNRKLGKWYDNRPGQEKGPDYDSHRT